MVGLGFALACLVAVLREPRRLRCGVLLLAALVSFALEGVGRLLGGAAGDLRSVWVLLGGLALAVGVVVVLGVMLILNGATMVRREGRRLSNLLGLFLGLAMVGYVGVGVAALFDGSGQLAGGVLLAGIPLSFLAYGFCAYLLYSTIYVFVTKRWAKPPAAVVVLGSGLIRGQVTPLLARRLDVGLALAERSGQPTLVVSGGKGSDEARSEASAMAEYLVNQGISATRIVREATSTTTRENIAHTKVLLAGLGVTGPVAAVTSNYHAFRAAMMLRQEQVPGYAVGAPIAQYYWPAATIREYGAILADSLPFTVVCLCLSVVPLLVWALTHLLP
jgi:uncharacterized SAM-binding protein YcdF (DUF218 family)